MLCPCRAGDVLCELCRDGLWMQLRGTAATRGENWAISVARRVRSRDPWPPHEGRAAELARAKVADLTRDAALLELLAAELAAWAARRWSQL